MPVELFAERSMVGENNYLTCEWHLPMGSGPDGSKGKKNKESKVSSMSCLLSLQVPGVGGLAHRVYFLMVSHT